MKKEVSPKKKFRFDVQLNSAKIETALKTFEVCGVKPTQKQLAAVTGISIRTIRKYLKKELV